MTSPSEIFPFMALPRELRDNTYRFMGKTVHFPRRNAARRIEWEIEPLQEDTKVSIRAVDAPTKNFMLVSKQFGEEYTQALKRETTVTFAIFYPKVDNRLYNDPLSEIGRRKACAYDKTFEQIAPLVKNIRTARIIFENLRGEPAIFVPRRTKRILNLLPRLVELEVLLVAYNPAAFRFSKESVFIELWRESSLTPRALAMKAFMEWEPLPREGEKDVPLQLVRKRTSLKYAFNSRRRAEGWIERRWIEAQDEPRREVWISPLVMFSGYVLTRSNIPAFYRFLMEDSLEVPENNWGTSGEWHEADGV